MCHLTCFLKCTHSALAKSIRVALFVSLSNCVALSYVFFLPRSQPAVTPEDRGLCLAQCPEMPTTFRRFFRGVLVNSLAGLNLYSETTWRIKLPYDVCVCECRSFCVCFCVFVSLRLCMFVCLRVWVFACLCVCMSLFLCLRMRSYERVCAYVFVSVCTLLRPSASCLRVCLCVVVLQRALKASCSGRTALQGCGPEDITFSVAQGSRRR